MSLTVKLEPPCRLSQEENTASLFAGVAIARLFRDLLHAETRDHIAKSTGG